MMVTGLQMKTAPNLIQVCFTQYKTKSKQNYVCFICSITCQPNLFINEEIVLNLTLLPKNLIQFLSFNFLVLLVHFINLLKLKTENQKKDQNTNKNIFKPILPLVQNKVRNDKKKSTKEEKGEINKPLPIYPIKILRRLEMYIFFSFASYIHSYSTQLTECGLHGKDGALAHVQEVEDRARADACATTRLHSMTERIAQDRMWRLIQHVRLLPGVGVSICRVLPRCYFGSFHVSLLFSL